MKGFDVLLGLRDKCLKGELEPSIFYLELWQKAVLLKKEEKDIILEASGRISGGNNVLISKHYLTVGMFSNFFGDFPGALKNCQLALSGFIESGDDHGCLSACCLSSIAYRSIGQLDLAQQMMQQAFIYLDRIGTGSPYYFFQAVTCYQGGELCQQFHKYADALERYKRGLTYINDSSELKGRLESGMGVTYSMMGNDEKAWEYFQKALRSIEGGENLLLESKIYSDISAFFLKSDDLNRALEYQQKSLKIREENKLISPAITSYVLLAEIYLKKGELETSILYASKAIDLAVRLNTKIKLFEAHAVISKAYEALGNIQLSFEHFKKYHDYKDQVHSEESMRKIEQLNVRHEIETKEKENEIFRLRNVELRSALEEIHDSFTYARRIQQALLPNDRYIEGILRRLVK